MDDNNGNERIQRLIEAGTEIVGGSTGALIGSVVGGPAGAVGGTVLGVVMSKGLLDFANRFLSHREEVKVGAVATYAVERINQRIESGERPREDGFFDPEDASRSPAEEVFEGVLQKSKNEHEEKKIKLLGNFFANLAFLPGVALGEANYLLRLAESLTYRQMLLLAIIAEKQELEKFANWRSTNFDNGTYLNYGMVSVLHELFDLYNLGLIVQQMKDYHGLEAIMAWAAVVPAQMRITPIGERLIQLLDEDDALDISTIEVDIVDVLFESLKDAASPDELEKPEGMPSEV